MFDDLASAFMLVLGLISTSIEKVTREDVTALLVSFAAVASVIVVRDVTPKLVRWSHGRIATAVRNYIHGLFTSYAYRFRTRGFRFETCKYSLWLAFALWLHAFLILSLWPSWTGLGIIILSALAVVLTLSVLGFNTRGTSRPGIAKFGIFYEPSVALVSTFLVGKLPELASRGLSKLATLVVSLIV